MSEQNQLSPQEPNLSRSTFFPPLSNSNTPQISSLRRTEQIIINQFKTSYAQENSNRVQIEPFQKDHLLNQANVAIYSSHIHTDADPSKHMVGSRPQRTDDEENSAILNKNQSPWIIPQPLQRQHSTYPHI